MSTLLYTFPIQEQEASVAFDYAYNSLFVRKFAVFYADDLMGIGSLNYLKETIKKHNLVQDIDYILVSHQSNSADTKLAAETINKFGPTAIFLLSTAAPTLSLISQLNAWDIKYFLSTSVLESISFQNIIKEKGLKLIKCLAVSFFEKSQLFLDYLKLIKEKKQDPEKAIFYGYAMVNLFAEIVDKINGPFSKASFLEVAKKLKILDLRGIKYYFFPEDVNILESFQLEDVDGNIMDINGKILKAASKSVKK